MTDIIGFAVGLSEAVSAFAGRCRRFFYAVMLWGHACPRCGGRLEMVREGRCRCRACGGELDPTVAFQRCSACGGVPRLSIRRYSCKQCGADVRSWFLFDGVVFNRGYFRQKMVESRQRKAERLDAVRQMLAESRSPALEPRGSIDLEAVAGLREALDGLTKSLPADLRPELESGFDLRRYQAHILAHVGTIPACLAEMPSLADDRRRDLIWRFVAAIFMAHAGLIDIWQDGQDIMVMQREIDRKGQELLACA